MSAAPGAARAGAVEVAPLSSRVLAMTGFRLLLVGVLLVLAAVDDVSLTATAAVSGVYLAVTGVFALTVLLPNRMVAVRSFTVSLLVDGIYVEYQRQLLHQDLPTDAVLAVFVVAVFLLASFRTGLKIALWQSVLMLVALRGQESGLFPGAGALGGGLDGEAAMAADLLMLWGVVITTAVAASTNERELKRRRYDAEALARFAARLHVDTRPEEVAQHVVDYAVEEQAASAALVVRNVGGRVTLVAGRTAEGPLSAAQVAQVAGAAEGSALLDLPRRDDGTVLALRLDPARDPWLAAVVPDARRILVLDLVDTPTERTSLVVTLGRRSDRVERRVVEAVLQAANTATLAWSRADLLVASERKAATDGLTGLANRRTFDALLAGMQEDWLARRAPYALVLVDVDHFKSVNDQYGHQAGDEVLQSVARILGEHAERAGAVAARYGGEEFALLHPGVDAAAAAWLAEQVRVALHVVVHPRPISASFGVAGVPEHAADTDTVIHVADAALIAAKNTGRDRVVVGGDHRMPASTQPPGAVPPPRRRDVRTPQD